jgi:serine/threonine protein kinase
MGILNKSGGSGCIQASYELGKVIGTGAFASVRRAQHRRTGRMMAIKIMDKRSEVFDTESLAQEIESMRRIDHPNCVLLHEVYLPHFLQPHALAHRCQHSLGSADLAETSRMYLFVRVCNRLSQRTILHSVDWLARLML